MQQKIDDKIVWDLEICKNIDILKKTDKIVIYGAGWKGNDIVFRLEAVNIKIDYFCDMNMDKWGNYIGNVKIVSPFEMKYMEAYSKEPVYVIVCMEFPQEVLHLFKNLKMENIRIITYWGIKMALHVNAKKLYEPYSKEQVCWQIESQVRKDTFDKGGFDWLYKLISVSDNAVWIVQPGKTATSSLEMRLHKKGIPYIKQHTLECPYSIKEECHKKLWRQIVDERKKKSLKIMMAVREPLARDYSAFWQGFSKGIEIAMEVPFLSNNFQKMYESYLEILSKGRKYMLAEMGDVLPYVWHDEFEWFDEQIKEYLDIDIFQYPFDKEKGYTIIKKGTIEVFLYKTEKLDGLLDEINSFVGIDGISKIDDNISSQKWYGLAYSQFRKEVRLPRKYVEHYYQGNAKMDYFYSQEEKEKFLDKWIGNIESIV